VGPVHHERVLPLDVVAELVADAVGRRHAGRVEWGTRLPVQGPLGHIDDGVVRLAGTLADDPGARVHGLDDDVAVPVAVDHDLVGRRVVLELDPERLGVLDVGGLVEDGVLVERRPRDVHREPPRAANLGRQRPVAVRVGVDEGPLLGLEEPGPVVDVVPGGPGGDAVGSVLVARPGPPLSERVPEQFDAYRLVHVVVVQVEDHATEASFDGPLVPQRVAAVDIALGLRERSGVDGRVEHDGERHERNRYPDATDEDDLSRPAGPRLLHDGLPAHSNGGPGRRLSAYPPR
jgi:hypothetical protein